MKKNNNAFLLNILLCIYFLSSCANGHKVDIGLDSQEINVRDVPRLSEKIDKKEVSIKGIVYLRQGSLNIVSSRSVNKQICVGLLISGDLFEKYKYLDGRVAHVHGRFEKSGCGEGVICHDSCGPEAIVVHYISK